MPAAKPYLFQQDLLFETREEGVAAGMLMPPAVTPNGGVFADEVVVTLSCGGGGGVEGVAVYSTEEQGPYRLYLGPFLWTRRGDTKFWCGCTTGREDSDVIASPLFTIKGECGVELES